MTTPRFVSVLVECDDMLGPQKYFCFLLFHSSLKLLLYVFICNLSLFLLIEKREHKRGNWLEKMPCTYFVKGRKGSIQMETCWYKTMQHESMR